MSEAVLTILKFVLVALIYLFFFRVIRAIWSELKEPASNPKKPEAVKSKSSSKAPRRGGGRVNVLRVLEPPEQKGRIYPVGDELTIGRARGCQISIDDNYTSQLHARIFDKNGDVFIEDLGSTNGTYMNRQRLNKPAPIKHGDRIQIGHMVMEARK